MDQSSAAGARAAADHRRGVCDKLSDDDYGEALEEIERVMGSNFMHRLDRLVGERMVACGDAALVQRLQLVVDGDENVGLAVTINDRTVLAPRLRPAKSCSCAWWRGERQRADHDALLAMEGDFDALVERLIVLATWQGNEHGPDVVGAYEWDDFINQHSWRDPVQMWWLGQVLRDLYAALKA